MSRERLRLVSSSLSRLRLPFGDGWTVVLVTFYFVGLSLLVFYPLLRPGYILVLDMIFSPHTDYVRFGLEVKGPLYYGRLPFLVILDAFGSVLDDWILQKTILVALVACCGLSAFVATDVESVGGRLFAGTVYAINPFVYVRLLVGHWYFLLGYAFLPVAAVALYHYLDGREEGSLARATLWTTVVSVFDPHTALLAVIVGACAALTVLLQKANPTTLVKRVASLSLAYLALNGYWLAPAFVTLFHGETELSSFSDADLAAFSAAGTVEGSVPLSVSMLYGFWRGGYRYLFDIVPTLVVSILFLGLLYLAVDGWLSRTRSPTGGVTNALALAGIVGAFLGMGVNNPLSEPVFRALFNYVPGFSGMRDSQKFVALLALAYALLGGIGADNLLGATRETVRGHFADLTTDDADAEVADNRAGVLLAQGTKLVVVALLAIPLIYTFPMFGGFGGQIGTTDYPADWYGVNDRLQEDDEEFRVLFLPWHGYIRFSWTEHTVATPAEMFFEVPVVQARSLDVGDVKTHATDPTHTQVRYLLAQESDAAYGSTLSELGIKYVILSKSADYEQYEYLRDQPDLQRISETDRLVLFENEAYEGSDSSSWPADGSRVPWITLFAGVAVSVITLAVFVVTRIIRR